MSPSCSRTGDIKSQKEHYTHEFMRLSKTGQMSKGELARILFGPTRL